MTMVVVTDLQTKVEKYESRASRCEEQARAATDKAQQTFYEVLAGYYSSLATDFRKIIEKRTVAYGRRTVSRSPESQPAAHSRGPLAYGYRSSISTRDAYLMPHALLPGLGDFACRLPFIADDEFITRWRARGRWSCCSTAC